MNMSVNYSLSNVEFGRRRLFGRRYSTHTPAFPPFSEKQYQRMMKIKEIQNGVVQPTKFEKCISSVRAIFGINR